MKRQTVCIIAGLAAACYESGTAGAALLSSVGYYQELTGQENGDSNTYTQSFSGTALPINQSQTLTLPDGNTITANYNFTQGANSASFNIGSDAFILYSNSELLQTHGDDPTQGLILTPSANVNYSIAFLGNASNGASSGIQINFVDLGGGTLASGLSQSQLDYNGSLVAGHSYLLQETWDLYLPLSLNGTPNTASGNSSFILNLNAIPEPSSVMMLFGSAVLLLKRPMRWTKVGLSNA